MANSPKIFGIGLPKTGTSTLGECLRTFGYRHLPYSRANLDLALAGNLDALFAIVEQNDSFEDWPWPLLYKELDERFPESKFILTVRKDAETWLESQTNHYLNKYLRLSPEEIEERARLRERLYGAPSMFQQPEKYLEFYDSFVRKVREYFSDHKGRFLEVCWDKDASWDELSKFLGKPVPDAAFPHMNKTTDQLKNFLVRALCNPA